MSSLPFRTAFWALGLSLMMTVMLMVPNPQKIRLALNAHGEDLEFPFQETLVTSLDLPEVVSPTPPVATEELPEIKLDESLADSSADSHEDASAESRRESRREMLRRRIRSSSAGKSEQAEEKSETAPVLVASADPTASIGYRPFPTSPRKAAPPVPEQMAPEKAAEATAPPVPDLAAAPISAEPGRATMKPLDIPVPEPHDPVPVRVAELPATRPEPSAKPVDSTGPEPVSHSPVPPSVIEPLARVKQPEPSTVATVMPGTPGISADAGYPVQGNELSTDSSISITTGVVPKRWNFRFQEAELKNVFKVLGQYQGYTVIVDEDLSGTFSGQFLEADPAQVFAVLVKSRSCRVSRRGNMILLTATERTSLR